VKKLGNRRQLVTSAAYPMHSTARTALEQGIRVVQRRPDQSGPYGLAASHGAAGSCAAQRGYVDGTALFAIMPRCALPAQVIIDRSSLPGGQWTRQRRSRWTTVSARSSGATRATCTHGLAAAHGAARQDAARLQLRRDGLHLCQHAQERPAGLQHQVGRESGLLDAGRLGIPAGRGGRRNRAHGRANQSSDARRRNPGRQREAARSLADLEGYGP
jgi:hypothetical protein